MSDWELAADTDEAYIWPKSGTFPTLYYRWDAMQIEFTTGYGAPEDVPAEIKHAALLILADFYEKREGGQLSENVESAVNALIGQRKYGFIG